MRPDDTRPGRQDHYAILGVPAEATPRQITDAYRALVRALHPDTAGAPGDTLTRFTAVTTAYAVLHDPARRAAYYQSRRAKPTAPPTDLPSNSPAARSHIRAPLLCVGPTRVRPLPQRSP